MENIKVLMTVYTKSFKSNVSNFLEKNQRSNTKRVDSSVSTVTGTRQPQCRCLIVGKKIDVSAPKFPSRLCDMPNLLVNGYRVLSWGRPEREAHTHTHTL
jgi:hypothetical protein